MVWNKNNKNMSSLWRILIKKESTIETIFKPNSNMNKVGFLSVATNSNKKYKTIIRSLNK